MKKWIVILAVVIAVAAGFAVVKDTLIKAAVEGGAQMVTGLKLSIRSLHAGILKTVVSIRDLRLANPAGFSDPEMVVMPEVYVHYDLPALLRGTVHLPEARVALAEFVVIKNAKGELNLNALVPVKAQKKGAKASQVASGKAPALKIDKLTLIIGKVVYKDYSRGGEPSVKEFPINLNETFTNVDDPYQLASLIVVKALMNTPVAALANIDLKGLQGTVGEALASAQKIAATAGNAKEAAAAVQVQAATAAKQAQDAAQQAAGSVKDLFKNNPFGSKE